MIGTLKLEVVTTWVMGKKKSFQDLWQYDIIETVCNDAVIMIEIFFMLLPH